MKLVIPASFWRGLSEAEWRSILGADGALDNKLCRKLWKHLGRTDRAPERMHIMLKSEDVMRLFPPEENSKLP